MPLLQTVDLSRSFEKKSIFKDVSFSIEKGEIVGLIGRSGCGKSTLIKTLIGFLKPTRGHIIINSSSGHPIGFSMQDNALYEYLTVKQNLQYFADVYCVDKKIRKERIAHIITQLNLEEYKGTLVKHLSGGTKKRVDLPALYFLIRN